MGEPRIAAVGDNTIDRFRDADDADLVGGNALNVAVQALRAGCDARYFGPIGDDADGVVVRAAIESTGLPTDGLRVETGRTALTVISRDADGDRRFVSEDFGVTAHYLPNTDELERIAQHEWVHIGMLPDAPRLAERLRRRRPNILISQDLAVSPEAGPIDVAFLPGSADIAADRTRTAAMVGDGVALAITTRGAAGAIAFDGTTWLSQLAIPTTVVDSTGAGDSFIAGFIASRARGRGIIESMNRGAHLAAATCGHLGGWPQR
ncbi:MAG: PfkB family carbohydrate kinase [Pseudolysinimonas sp.]|uniref:PfkB family carbohydrate kinase n=1 Tax=Pseudolysinimonas sp. TaxID=2680009 RepID=UPI003C734680